MILKEIKKHNKELLDKALDECIKWHLFCATDFIDMVQYLNRQNVSSVNNKKRQIDLKHFNYLSESVSQTKAQTRDIQEYVSVLEGEIQWVNYQQLQDTLKSLRFGETANNLPALFEKTEKDNVTYAAFLMDILSYEQKKREEKQIENRLKWRQLSHET